MTHKLTLILVFTIMFVNGQAQKSQKNKCKPIFDKEINREVYENVDTQPVFADTTINDNILVSEKFKFKVK